MQDSTVAERCNKLLCHFLKEQRPYLKEGFSYVDDTVIYHLTSWPCPICTQSAVDKLSSITASSRCLCCSSDSVFSKYVCTLRSWCRSAHWGPFWRHPLRISAKSESRSMLFAIRHARTYKCHLEILNRHWLDIVGTVYHLVIYMQSNKVHRVF